MRPVVFAAVIAACCPAFASASPYYAGPDKARYAKLLPLVGTYRCSDTSGDPLYSAAVTVDGAWIVWRESDDDPATEYLRWDGRRKLYVVLEVEHGGGYNASSTAGPDPLNATWAHDYPVDPMYSTFTTSFAKGVFTLSAKYLVHGKPRIGRLSCKKTSS